MLADEILDIVKLEVRDTQGQYDKQLRYYLRSTVREIAKRFQYGPVEVTETVTADSSGAFTIVGDVGEVIGIWDGVKRFEVVGPIVYRQRDIDGNGTPTVRVFEDANGWHGQVLQNATSATTLTVVYKTTTGDPTILPSMYEEHVITGILAKFYRVNSKANPEVYYNHRDEFRRLMKDIDSDANRNTGEDLRIYGLSEVESTDAGGRYESLQRDVHL